MEGLRGEELLRRPVRVRGIQLGRAVDLILDESGRRVLGLDVLCGDGEHRFLPIAAAEAAPGRIDVHSALTLLDPDQLAFYRRHGTTLTSLRARDRDDVRLGEDGTVVGRVTRDESGS
jgi:hypothetical protein